MKEISLTCQYFQNNPIQIENDKTELILTENEQNV